MTTTSHARSRRRRRRRHRRRFDRLPPRAARRARRRAAGTGRLTCGTTWHAAGLVGQTRATRNATRMSRYGIELYSSLEKETGLATGWKQCGSLNVAKTPERLKLMKRQMARAKSFGIEFEFVSPAEAGRIAPILRTDDLAGAVWIPGRRQSESDRSHPIAGQRRAHARRAHRRRRQGRRRRRRRAGASRAFAGRRPRATAKSPAKPSSTAAASGRANSDASPASMSRSARPSISTS